MDPLDDRELNALLREWKAPAAPAGLEPRVFRRQPWWRWLLTGTIRVPVPVGAAALLLLALLAYSSRPAPAPTPVSEPEPVLSLADFQPVANVEPRVVGEVK